MLTTTYKIFAKVRRLSRHLKEWIRPEQKGFIKGRFILDAIIGLWERVEHAEETIQDYIFFKIDFDKAYDRLSWQYMIEALKHMGCGDKFCSMVKTLLGNASARINVNGELTEGFRLSSSIRQGCPLASLLYAVAVDGLNWLVQDSISSGRVKGVTLGNGEQVCIEMFTDDTNALLENEATSIAHFWECLHIYCKASGSVINHNKTAIRTFIQSPPDWIVTEGCKQIQDGEIIRILGIPMGFKVSLRKRW